MYFPQSRNPWPWAIALTFVLFISAQMLMIRLAVRDFEGPDSVQYYKMGLEYSQEIKRQKLQRELGWQLKSNLNPPVRPGANWAWQGRMLDKQGQVLQGELWISFKRPATKAHDQKVQALWDGTHFNATWNAEPGPWVVEYEFTTERLVWKRSQRCIVEKS